MCKTMLEQLSPLAHLRQSLTNSTATPTSVAAQSLAHANTNASQNTYLWLHPADLRAQAAALELFPQRPPLWSIPISLKDCFDLAGAPTTCGSRFYAQRPPADADSSLAASIRQSGALITGKTHLHPLAYGITGENPDYGDCLQPRDPTLLTGGSSSGAAASVQEGSALAALGTDTGGSIRVPAALCGLTGYRASHRLPSLWWPQAWQGASHLAPSFDTLGLLFRDPRDAAPLATALLGVPPGTPPLNPRIGYPPAAFLYDCEPDVLAAYEAWKQTLAATGAQLSEFNTTPWDGAPDIFAGIQASEAAALHSGHFDHFEPAIRDRLAWGAALRNAELAVLHLRLTGFRTGMRALLARFDFLMLPAAPVSRLPALADHSAARPRILRYTCPFSLSGLPALSLPGELIGAPLGTGIQLAAAPGEDPTLLAYAEALGHHLAPPA
jgi:Asp-tRNA(Asn)/Glu-tRNA(Gln) amidotransferase A subunit family amidase